MARTWMATTVTLLAVVTAVSLCSAGEPSENQWGPFTGTVVDANTKQPIPGAVFTVFWMKVTPFPFQGVEQFFDARVAVADEQGHFEIPRRSRPFLILGGVKSPYLSCVAPGYAPYQHVGAQNAPISVKLRPLTPEERRPGGRGSRDDALVTIPLEMGREFQKAVNLKRQQMRLPPIDFYTASVEGAAK
jgi:hypothetical protein